MKLIAAVIAFAVVACSNTPDQPPTQTTYVFSAPEAARPAIGVRRFEVSPEKVRVGEPVTVKIELDAQYPGRELAVDWHGPDGWVVAHDVIDAAATRITTRPPAGALDEEGRYRAVLRSGIKFLAEDQLAVSG